MEPTGKLEYKDVAFSKGATSMLEDFNRVFEGKAKAWMDGYFLCIQIGEIEADFVLPRLTGIGRAYPTDSSEAA